MMRDDVIEGLRAIVRDDQVQVSRAAAAVAEAIRVRHPGAVRGLVFYGSALRQGEQSEKMLDFYAIVSSYRAVHGNGLKQLASFLIPPSVHFLEIRDEAGNRLRSKYAIVSEKAFHRRTRGGAFETMLWARFAQPATVIADDPDVHAALMDTLAFACLKLADEARPLVKRPYDSLEPWVRGLAASYRTELRPENPDARAREIVLRFEERYRRLSALLFPENRPEADGLSRMFCRARWIARQVAGKPMGAIRVLKAAATFDAGLDYILEKIESHSGVRLEVTEKERKRPVLNAPMLAWRLYRAGAFR
ncbi:MAG: hypothetical protein WEA77_13260 [Hyphomonas sp.]|uniref:hypothetical protein n=1 Tax=Hyphomonas sp. TaxID=87 RepID=UPI0034A001D8